MDKRSEDVRILIADDHAMFRDGLRQLLEAEPDFRVIGEASDGKEAVRDAWRLKPDILLLDLTMPKQSGLDALRELQRLISLRTILLTAAIDKKQAIEALRLGARGLMLKDSTTELLRTSIRSVLAGHYWLGQESVSDIVEALRNLGPLHTGTKHHKPIRLTPRELEIVAAIVSGYTNKDIAQKFSLSEQTVKHHLTSIFDKLGVSNRLELALLAVNHHLVGEE